MDTEERLARTKLKEDAVELFFHENDEELDKIAMLHLRRRYWHDSTQESDLLRQLTTIRAKL